MIGNSYNVLSTPTCSTYHIIDSANNVNIQAKHTALMVHTTYIKHISKLCLKKKTTQTVNRNNTKEETKQT